MSRPDSLDYSILETGPNRMVQLFKGGSGGERHYLYRLEYIIPSENNARGFLCVLAENESGAIDQANCHLAKRFDLPEAYDWTETKIFYSKPKVERLLFRGWGSCWLGE